MNMANPCPNQTLVAFGYPNSCLAQSHHWAVLLRPRQLTPGSLVVASLSEATAFGALPDGAHADLKTITARTEAMLQTVTGYERINWLMLMMVDPHVHFHVFPRFPGARTVAGTTWVDADWPGPPTLAKAEAPSEAIRDHLFATLKSAWR